MVMGMPSFRPFLAVNLALNDRLETIAKSVVLPELADCGTGAGSL
jgi:hypothetical protein